MNRTQIKHPAHPTDWANPITHVRVSRPWTFRAFLGALAMAALALVLAFLPTQASAQFVSGRLLAAHINGSEEQQTQAGYYIIGVFDAYKGAQHCAPAETKVEQVLPLASQFLLANPQWHNQPADHLLGFLFSQAWPCPKKGREV